jgi:hypothetical protein
LQYSLNFDEKNNFTVLKRQQKLERIEKSGASNKKNAFWLRKEAQLSVIFCGYPSYKLDLKLLSFIRTLKGII